MKLWLIGGTMLGLLGFSLYLSAVKRSEPVHSESALVVEVETQAASPPAPLAIHPVVDVTDIEALLDPPAIPPAEPTESGPVITRVGYEETAPARQPSTMVKPIPKAKD